MSKRISRAKFISALVAGTAAASGIKICLDANMARKNIKWRMLGPSRALGHQLRNIPKVISKSEKQTSKQQAADAFGGQVLRKKLLIVGGGIAGLSAAWWLKKQGFDDFALLELEKEAGGNSTWGKNEICSYPWGAHYVPIANAESELVKELFEELEIIEAYAGDLPVYNELYLCHEPQERLFKDGRFQEGLVPKLGLQKEEEEEIGRFFALVSQLRKRQGRDGKPAFAIPLDLSSSDPELRNLDRVSMSDWLKSMNFKSRPLLWYIKYCCRDDYGASPENVSAWAGLHYFAGRRGRAANAEMNSVLTWPEGNGYIVKKLRDQLSSQIICSSMVKNISGERPIVVSYIDVAKQVSMLAETEFLIFAAPRFLAKHIIEGYPHPVPQTTKPEYAPWLVANISLNSAPEGKGEQLAWDNVSYYSQALGYVVAKHQEIRTRDGGPTVITYYYPFSNSQPEKARYDLLAASGEQLLDLILNDLEKMHPGITAEVITVDFWTWGHGMVRPSPGYIWGNARHEMQKNMGRIYFAHSDMSGISNFEEAQYQGVKAAKNVLEAAKA